MKWTIDYWPMGEDLDKALSSGWEPFSVSQREKHLGGECSTTEDVVWVRKQSDGDSSEEV